MTVQRVPLIQVDVGVTILQVGDLIDDADGERFYILDMLQTVDEHGEDVTTVILRNLSNGKLLSQALYYVKDMLRDGAYRLVR